MRPRRCHAASPCVMWAPGVFYSPGGVARPPAVLYAPRSCYTVPGYVTWFLGGVIRLLEVSHGSQRCGAAPGEVL